MANENTEHNVELIPMPDLETSKECTVLFKDFNDGITSLQTRNEGEAALPKWLENSIKNISYTLAAPIIRQIGEGGGVSEPQLATFVKRSGDSMNGHLNANNGFSAGIGNIAFLRTKQDKDKNNLVLDSYLSIEGKMKIKSTDLFIDNKVIFKHFTRNDNKEVMEVYGGELVDFKTSDINIGGVLTANKLSVSPTSFTYSNNIIYHAGNSNGKDFDWSMRNASVFGDMGVQGNVSVGKKLVAINTVELGRNNSAKLTIGVDTKHPNDIILSGDLSLGKECKIKINNTDVLGVNANTSDIFLNSIGGNIHLGKVSGKGEIVLHNTLAAEGGNDLIDRFGAATFMNSLKAGHGNNGKALMETCDEGIVIGKQLMFNNKDTGPKIYSDTQNTAQLSTHFTFQDGSVTKHKTATIAIERSTSVNLSPGSDSQALVIDTTADYIRLGHPVEAATYIGLTGSETRLTSSTLFFTEHHKLSNFGSKTNFFSSGGIEHYGDAVFRNSLFSPKFSTGFAGEGFCIRKRTEDGNYEITTDYLFVRKKFTTYELEVQKINVINGSLWVSSTCSGDTVKQIQ